VLAADNNFFVTHGESVDADANDFFKCHDNVCADMCMCLFCLNCAVNLGAVLYTGNSTTILLAGVACEFFHVIG
jgi:hypothetical protein